MRENEKRRDGGKKRLQRVTAAVLVAAALVQMIGVAAGKNPKRK